MKALKSIPIWENKRRLKRLNELSDLLREYYNNAKYHRHHIFENEKAKKLRQDIHLIIDDAHRILIGVGVYPNITHTPPPIIGGRIEDVNVLYNFHNLNHYHMNEEYVYDFISTAIGIYSADTKWAWIRTFNPFFWLGYVLDFIGDIPLRILSHFGFDMDKLQEGFFGKLIKALVQIIIIVAALSTIMHLWGLLEPVKSFLK